MAQRDAPFVVEWYRLDASKRTARVLGLGASFVLFGSIFTFFSIWGSHWQTAFGILGAVLTVGGPIVAISGLKKILKDDEYLLVRTDGLFCHIGHEKWSLLWDDIHSVSYDPTSTTIKVETENGACYPMHYSFAGVDPKTLAQRLEEVRRKAIWNLLRR